MHRYRDGSRRRREARATAGRLARSPASTSTWRGGSARRAPAPRRCGRPGWPSAANTLREALALARRCGALAAERRAAAELDAAGARQRRRPLDGPAALTPSELRVARMAATGMTNRQIAQALFVTTKAVQFHLGNAYRKLNVGGREELTGALEHQPER